MKHVREKSAFATRPSRAPALAVLLALLTACGQSGPLYLPEDAPPRAAPAADEAAPPGPEEDDDEGSRR